MEELQGRISQLTEKTEDDLYRELAQEMLGRQAIPLDPRELVERGRRLFEAQRPKLESAACESNNIKLFAEDKHDTAEIVIELLKIIYNIILPVSPVIIGVLIAKKGLKTFCNNHWRQ